jgi:hypothetical protein
MASAFLTLLAVVQVSTVAVGSAFRISKCCVRMGRWFQEQQQCLLLQCQ